MGRHRGNWLADPRQVRLMEWLCTPKLERQPQTQVELAKELGVDKRTVFHWMNNPAFRSEWSDRVQDQLDPLDAPERVQAVLDKLFEASIDPTNRNHVQAAKLYLEATNALKPQQLNITVSSPDQLSDEELDRLLAEGAAAVKAKREEAG